MISDGGGVKNRRKANGKANCLRVCGLKRIRISPVAKIGRVKMWYSRGVNVYEPY